MARPVSGHSRIMMPKRGGHTFEIHMSAGMLHLHQNSTVRKNPQDGPRVNFTADTSVSARPSLSSDASIGDGPVAGFDLVIVTAGE